MSVSTRKSDGQIFVQWKEEGKLKRKYFGIGPAANTAATEFNKTVVKTAPPSGGSAVHAGGVLFIDLVNSYMTWKKVAMSSVSFENMQWKFSGKILPIIGHTMVHRITHSTLDSYVMHRSRYVKMTTIHRELSDIRAILNWAVRRKMISQSPMAGYDMPTRDDAVVQPPSKEEIERMIAHSSEHLKRAMLLSYFCGMRPGAVELLSIRYSQINWSASTLTVISAQKGGAAQREVPIHPALPLRSWFEADGCREDAYIITWKGQPIRSLKTAFNAAKRRAGVSGRKIPLYSLRHAFVTTLLHLGVDIHTIANISGHDVRTMLKHYAHAMDDVRVSAIGKLPELIITAPPSAVVQKEGK